MWIISNVDKRYIDFCLIMYDTLLCSPKVFNSVLVSCLTINIKENCVKTV